MGDNELDNPVGQVIILHLTNGKVLIGMVSGQDEDGFILDHPLEIITAVGNEGLRVGFGHYLTCNGLFPPLDKHTVTYDQIVLPRTCPSELEANYREATGMIQVPAQPSIILPGQ